MTTLDKPAFYKQMDDLLEASPGTVHGLDELAALESWDSLAVMSFIAMADSKYGVSFSAKAITACRTVDDLAALVEANLRA
jgi:acyl carrier protein